MEKRSGSLWHYEFNSFFLLVSWNRAKLMKIFQFSNVWEFLNNPFNKLRRYNILSLGSCKLLFNLKMKSKKGVRKKSIEVG